MTMKTTELYEKLNRDIPASLSAEWDNDGLMVLPTPEHEAKKILFVLDVTEAVIDQAMTVGCDLIISHHPFLFRPLPRFCCTDEKTRLVLKLVASGIAVFSFHTRLDAAEGGVNDALAALLALQNVEPFICEDVPLGRVGELPAPMAFDDFLAFAAKKLRTPQLSYICEGALVRRVALIGGDGKDYIREAQETGADVYLTGQASYNSILDAKGGGMSIIEAGHYHTEAPVLKLLAERVRALGFEGEAVICDDACEVLTFKN